MPLMLLPRRHKIIHRFRFLLALMILLCIAATAMAEDAPSTPAPLKLEIHPAEITLDMSTEEHSQLLVVAHNPNGTPVGGNLKFVAPLGLVAKVVESSPMPSAGDLFWVVDVTGTGRLPSPVKLVAELRYSSTGQPQVIVAATATITLAPPQSVTEAIKATLLPAEGSVDELTPLNLQLRINNTARRSVEVKDKDIKLLAPNSKYVTLLSLSSSAPPTGRVSDMPGGLASPNCHNAGASEGSAIIAPGGSLDIPPSEHSTIIAPGGSLDIPLELCAKPAIPGTYALVLNFNVRFLDTPAADWQATTAQSKITIGVPGVTEALQFLGIPSLLLLPGALMILTFVTVLPWLTPQRKIDWKQPSLLLLAILLSFGAAHVYPKVTKYELGVARDYLQGYDLHDVVYLWTGAMVVGLGAASLIAIVYHFVTWLRAFYANLYEPQEGEEAINVLRKLHHHSAPFKLRQRRRTAQADGETQLLLPFGQAPNGRQWLVPRAIVVTANTPIRNEIQRLLERIDLAAPGAVNELVQKIESALSAMPPQVTLQWPNHQNAGPQLVNISEYVDAGGPQLFVRLEN